MHHPNNAKFFKRQCQSNDKYMYLQMSFSPRGIIFCFLCQWPVRMMLPYTNTSLKRKKTLGWVFRRPCFIRRPCPISIRPGLDRVFPDVPNEFFTALMRMEFSLSNVSRSVMMTLSVALESQMSKVPAAVFKKPFLPDDAVWDFPSVV